MTVLQNTGQKITRKISLRIRHSACKLRQSFLHRSPCVAFSVLIPICSSLLMKNPVVSIVMNLRLTSQYCFQSQPSLGCCEHLSLNQLLRASSYMLLSFKCLSKFNKMEVCFGAELKSMCRSFIVCIFMNFKRNVCLFER